mmetsp:Transcript_34999/g.103981  ORF Transcript_34999/g.103981 Transcript_34999/m.103981 type:complete len:201 (-) Transcript_34999:199-801(-)
MRARPSLVLLGFPSSSVSRTCGSGARGDQRFPSRYSSSLAASDPRQWCCSHSLKSEWWYRAVLDTTFGCSSPPQLLDTRSAIRISCFRTAREGLKAVKRGMLSRTITVGVLLSLSMDASRVHSAPGEDATGERRSMTTQLEDMKEASRTAIMFSTMTSFMKEFMSLSLLIFTDASVSASAKGSVPVLEAFACADVQPPPA